MSRWVYKILRSSEWSEFKYEGRFTGSAVDQKDGFIHLSYAQQVPETARRHFAGERGLRLLAIRSDVLGAVLVNEPSREGDLFPHLYSPLALTQIAQTMPLETSPDGLPLVPALEDQILC